MRRSVHSICPSVSTFCLSGTISQYLLVRFYSFLVQMISIINSRYPISLVKIDLLTLELLPLFKYSQISVIRTSTIRNYWVIRRRQTVRTFFSIIYCNKTTNYSNFYYPIKNQFFEVIRRSQLKKLLLNYPSRFEVQMSRMVIMISLFGRVRFTHLSDLANKV